MFFTAVDRTWRTSGADWCEPVLLLIDYIERQHQLIRSWGAAVV